MEGLLTPCRASTGSPADLIVWTLEQLLERVPVSRSTVYRWIEQEGLPVVRIGGSTRPLFLPQSISGWLESRQQQKATEAAQPPNAAESMNLAAAEHLRLLEARRSARRPRSRRTPPPPVAAAGSRERLRRIRGAR